MHRKVTGGRFFRAFSSENIVFADQPIAMVVAETFEQARAAANMITAEYSKDKRQLT